MRTNKTETDFERAGAEHPRKGVFISLWCMLMENKKWWLIPVVFMLAILGLLVFLSGSAAAPFIYTLF